MLIAPSSREECNGVSRNSPYLPCTPPAVLTPDSRVGKPPLVAAVSEAGGLGMSPIQFPSLCTSSLRFPGILTALTQPSPEALRVAIRETRKLTSKPFGVNITLLPTINPPDYQGYARVAVEEGIRIFETVSFTMLMY